MKKVRAGEKKSMIRKRVKGKRKKKTTDEVNWPLGFVAYLLSFTVGNFRAKFGIIRASKLQDPHFPVPFLTNQLVDFPGPDFEYPWLYVLFLGLQKRTQHGLRFLLISGHVFTEICLYLCLYLSLFLPTEVQYMTLQKYFHRPSGVSRC